MNFIPKDLFSFTKKNKLTSQFKGTKHIAQTLGLNVDEVAIQSLNPELLFKKLIKEKIDLELIQVFTLMGWENNLWKSKNGKTAMRNLWLSALDKDRQGESVFRQVMTLRVILADTERYPAPKDVIQTMRIGLEELIKSGEWKYSNNLDVLQALISQKAKTLANIAFEQQKSVIQLIKDTGFPQKLPLIQDAEILWLDQWIASEKSKRQSLRQALSQTLTHTLSLERQKQITNQIINASTLPKAVQDLEKRVEDYPELVTWLSTCARNADFKAKLDLNYDEKQRLACWIGTGNYESLRKILINIASIRDQDTVNKTTANRYIFWKNYQALFQEAWLLLPTTLFERHETHLNNVKKISAYSYPVVVLKLENKFIFQSFLGDASQNDLLMTDDVIQVERILNQDTINYEDLKNLNLILIHDHAFKWQADLAYTLDKHFSIQPKDKVVHYMEGRYKYSKYLEEIEQSYFKSERKDWENLPRWVENNKRDRKYSEHVFNHAALTAIRYGLVVANSPSNTIQTPSFDNELEQGVWTDPNTGLMWARINIGQKWINGQCLGHTKILNWYTAQKECQNLELAGYHDWRLPSIQELKTLMIHGQGYNCPQDIMFKAEKDRWGFYWSSSSSANNMYAWYIGFDGGFVYETNKNSNSYVRAVRGNISLFSKRG